MIYNFTPSDTSVFQFQPTLDNTVFTVTVTWNIFGERYYVNIHTLQGELVYTMPLIGSTQDYSISLLPPLNPITRRPWLSSMHYIGIDNVFVVTS